MGQTVSSELSVSTNKNEITGTTHFTRGEPVVINSNLKEKAEPVR